MSSKNLIIIGAYPNTEQGVKILKETILSLNEHFDIALTTHYPVDKELQFLVKYYIYDIRNEFITSDSIHLWADYPTFYTEMFNDKTNSHHSFAVFRSMMNGVNLLKDYYDDFYYIEGDCIFEEKDIETLKQIKTNTLSSNKEACFFVFPDFLSTLVFYSKMNFFTENISFCKTSEEYSSCCDKISSYGGLENYLYRNINFSNSFDKVLQLMYIQPTDYFPNSKMGLNSVVEGQTVFFKSFWANAVRVENSNEIALIYLNNNESVYKEDIEIYLDDKLIITFPSGKYAGYFLLYPKNDDFILKVGQIALKYNKQEVQNGKSFLRIKENENN